MKAKCNKPSNRVIFPNSKWKNCVEIRFFNSIKWVLDTFRIKFGILELTLFFGVIAIHNLQGQQNTSVSLVVLGTVQDAGSPHIGCKKECCALLFETPDPTRKVVSLGVIDHENQQTFLFEATPDMPSQLKTLKTFSGIEQEIPNGVFLTHAHIGHYTGLMYFGREALGGKSIPIYAMPKMKAFLETNGPWSQLVSLKNIILKPLEANMPAVLTNNLKVIPFTVPHRDEYSETVGYKIIGPNKSVLFIPDIDKWNKWSKDIRKEIAKVDYAFLDASFFDGQEIDNRDISEIPHPFVVESIELFNGLPPEEKSKIHFIHFNHTNPLLNANSDAYKMVNEKNLKVATFKDIFKL